VSEPQPREPQFAVFGGAKRGRGRPASPQRGIRVSIWMHETEFDRLDESASQHRTTLSKRARDLIVKALK
jgi:hypothetical protein